VVNTPPPLSRPADESNPQRKKGEEGVRGTTGTVSDTGGVKCIGKGRRNPGPGRAADL